MVSLLHRATINKSSAEAEMGDHGHNRHGLKRGRGCCAVHLSRRAGTPSSTMWPGPRCTSVPSGVFIHPAVWPQWTWTKIGWGGCALFSEGSLVPIEHSCLGRGLPLYQVPSWSIQPFGHNGHWPKIGVGAVTCAEAYGTSIPSGILMHPAV